MKKTGILWKLGCIALSAASFCSTVQAQSGNKYSSTKSVEAVATPSGQRMPQPSKNQNNLNLTGTSKNLTDSKQVEPAIGINSKTSINKGDRNCTPKNSNKPYSITMVNFLKLPKDRQEFILNNLNKYTIID